MATKARDSQGRFRSRGGNGDRPITNEDMQDVLKILGAVAMRADIAQRLGKSFDGDRKLYEALGYPTELKTQDFMAKYRRNGFARAVINKPVNACWRSPPTVSDSKEGRTESPFEKQWKDVVKSVPFWSVCKRADKLATLGNYSVIFLGFDNTADINDLKNEVTSASRLAYMKAFSQDSAKIETLVTDMSNDRYGHPEIYTISMKETSTVSTSGGATKQVPVHWSRVIHVVEDPLEDDLRGMPALESIYNRLLDLEKVVGGSAEIFWRAAFPGYAFELDKDATLTAQTKAELYDQIEKYFHKLDRYLRVQGMTVKELAQQVASPKDQVDVALQEISAARDIPKRILVGSERGELASQDDRDQFNTSIQERQNDHCGPNIVIPITDRLVKARVIAEPIGEYTLDWPDVTAPSATQTAEVAVKQTQAIKNWIDSGGVEYLPPIPFFREILSFREDVIDRLIAEVAAMQAVDADTPPSEPVPDDGGEDE